MQLILICGLIISGIYAQNIEIVNTSMTQVIDDSNSKY